MTDLHCFVVLVKRDTDPIEYFPFHCRRDAEEFYGKAGWQWSGVQLLRVLRDGCTPRDEQPIDTADGACDCSSCAP